MAGTNFNSFKNAFVKVSLTDANNNASEAECNGDPNVVATDSGYTVGCIMRRTDLSSGSALYQNKNTITAPYWYVI